MEDSVLLTKEDKALLLRVSSMLEEILETLEFLEDEDTMKSMKEAEEDIEAGRVRSYDKLIEELKETGEI